MKTFSVLTVAAGLAATYAAGCVTGGAGKTVATNVTRHTADAILRVNGLG